MASSTIKNIFYLSTNKQITVIYDPVALQKSDVMDTLQEGDNIQLGEIFQSKI